MFSQHFLCFINVPGPRWALAQKAPEERVPSHSSNTFAVTEIIYSVSHPREISPSSGNYSTSAT